MKRAFCTLPIVSDRSKSILAVLDPSARKQPALERAAWLAQALSLRLDLLICDYDPHLSGERFADSATLRSARQSLLNRHLKRLRRIRSRFANAQLEVSIDARWAHPLDEGVRAKALETHPTLVVKDTHFHPALKRSVFSNTDWDLIRHCPAPLLLVKPRPIGPNPIWLAAVDPLHGHAKPALLDHAILEIGRELSSATHGDLHVLHAFDAAAEVLAESDTTASPILLPLAESLLAAKARHEEALSRLVQDYGLAASHVHLLAGETHDVLLRLSEQLPADVVIMGALSRGALERIFVGSTAERALDRIPCDLLVVKIFA
jgi:universal stress protein E